MGISICPFCGCEIKRGNNNHLCNKKISFLENLNIDDLKEKYVDEEYSIKDLMEYINEKYKDILFSNVPDSFVRKLVKQYLSSFYRNVKSSTNTKKKKEKYEDTMMERFGCKHNFEKNCESRKAWEKRLFEEEGITNVFQRESVKEKINNTMLEKYGGVDGVKKIRGFYSTKEGFQEKYGDDWEAEWERCIQLKKTASVDFYKNRYGDNWEYYWNKHLDNVKNSFVGSNFNGLNKKCYDILNKYNLDFEKEFAILKNNNAYGKGYYYFYDIKISNLLIELNGTYWHCDPRKYNSTDIIKFPNNDFKRVQDIWDKDKDKINHAIQNGFYIETIWEEDFSEDKLIEILKKYNLWNK